MPTGATTYYDALRLPLRALFSVLMRVHADGVARMPKSGGVVVVCNHLTIIDPLVLGVCFPRQLHFMAKDELFRNRLLGWYLTKAGTFPVRREEVDRAALKYAESLLRAGEAVMLFPEGHRSASAQMQSARSGAVMLAARTNSPVLPVAISGTERLRWIADDSFRSGPLSRPLVRLRVGQPIVISGSRGGRERKAASMQVMKQIVSMLPPAYHGVYGTE